MPNTHHDPGQLSSSFLSGPTLSAAQVDTVNDRVCYLKLMPDGTYLECNISPANLYAAMSA